MSFVRRSLSLKPTTVVDTKLALNIIAYNDLLELIEGDPLALSPVIEAGKVVSTYQGLKRDMTRVTGTGGIIVTLVHSGNWNRIEGSWGSAQGYTMPANVTHGAIVCGAGYHSDTVASHGARVRVAGVVKDSQLGTDGASAEYCGVANQETWDAQIYRAVAGHGIFSIRFG